MSDEIQSGVGGPDSGAPQSSQPSHGHPASSQPDPAQPASSQPSEWTMETLDAMLLRALRMILVLGLVFSLILWKASGWRSAAMLATGAAISAASTLEWRRLAHFINARFENKQETRGAGIAVLFFMLRLVLFAAAIYGSLRWIQGSAIALFFGLGLALLATVWQALRLLRD
jgi:hypothetical protein